MRACLWFEKKSSLLRFTLKGLRNSGVVNIEYCGWTQIEPSYYWNLSVYGTMSSINIEQMQKTLAMPTAPLDKTSFPTAVDTYGRPLDPTTIVHMRLPRADE